METFLNYVVKGLVDRPDAVTIAPTERNGMTVYELRVHPTDMGKIIGRQGATINAIRALLLVGSAKRGLRCAVEVVDEENSGGGAAGSVAGSPAGGAVSEGVPVSGGYNADGDYRPSEGGGGQGRPLARPAYGGGGGGRGPRPPYGGGSRGRSSGGGGGGRGYSGGGGGRY